MSAEEKEHGVEAGVYDNAVGGVALICLCGEMCRGDNWEEAGCAMDEHLEEEDAT